MATQTRLLAVPVLALALAAAGCKESTSPATVDPTTMATAVDNFTQVFTGNAAFQSLSALSPSFTLTAPVALPSAPWGANAASVLPMMRQMADRAPGAVLALFPANVLGKTFQWDTASGGRYRITDSTLAGASPNGVRFFLYVVVPGTHRPLLPLQKIAYVDVIDASTPQANILHIIVQYGSQTVADYTITGVTVTSGLTLTANGYVTDGVTQTTFTLQHQLTISGADTSLVTDYQVSNSAASVSMHTTISGAGGENLTVDWLVQKNGSIEVVGTITAVAINVAFKINGSTWATVIGDPNAPTITGANGRQLSQSDLAAMAQILAGFAAISENLNGVFGPAFIVFVV